jgi:hypothetical protein
LIALQVAPTQYRQFNNRLNKHQNRAKKKSTNLHPQFQHFQQMDPRHSHHRQRVLALPLRGSLELCAKQNKQMKQIVEKKQPTIINNEEPSRMTQKIWQHSLYKFTIATPPKKARFFLTFHERGKDHC